MRDAFVYYKLRRNSFTRFDKRFVPFGKSRADEYGRARFHTYETVFARSRGKNLTRRFVAHFVSKHKAHARISYELDLYFHFVAEPRRGFVFHGKAQYWACKTAFFHALILATYLTERVYACVLHKVNDGYIRLDRKYQYIQHGEFRERKLLRLLQAMGR